MKTRIINLEQNNINIEALYEAAVILKNGGLVAFPTETVYGLGANALSQTAVEGIFKAKGRPADNPLIVHIADIKELNSIAVNIPTDALKLASAFWPGPLTMVLPKAQGIPQIVTAGLPTVAVRLPAHPIARRLIELAGVPVAAPSANISGRPSPTVAAHVIEDLTDRVDIIIDGGNAQVGLESTVIDLSCEPPIILRPGGITYAQIKEIIPSVINDISDKPTNNEAPKSPGMKYKHYAPKAKLYVFEGEQDKVIAEIKKRVIQAQAVGLKAGVLAHTDTVAQYNAHYVYNYGKDKKELAANLFLALREFDNNNVNIIFSEPVEDGGIGTAIKNRLYKAAAYNIIRL